MPNSDTPPIKEEPIQEVLIQSRSSSTSSMPIKPIVVNSFDFDGCLFNQRYKPIERVGVIAANREFLANIKKQQGGFSKSITFIGSNRQSWEVDKENRVKGGKIYGSCFDAIVTISDYLEAEFDPFMMADIDGNLTDGETYTRCIEELYRPHKPQKHNGFTADETKVTIIYAQIHKVVQNNPNVPIEFHFYDDRVDILESLNNCFTQNTELLPSNVELYLHRYDGELHHPSYQLIRGTGDVDVSYRKTINIMGRIAREQAKIDAIDTWFPIDVAKYIDINLIKEDQSKDSKTVTSSASSSASNSSDNFSFKMFFSGLFNRALAKESQPEPATRASKK